MIFKSLIFTIVPALLAKKIEIEQHPDHIFKIESIRYSGKDKTGWLQFEDIKISSNGLEESHDVKDDYFELHPNKTKKLNKEWLFYKAQDCSIRLNLYDWQSEEYGEPKLDCNVDQHGHVEMKLGQQTYEIKYSVKQMPRFEKYFQLMYLWDLTTPAVLNGDDLYLRQQINYHGNTYTWKIPREDYFEFERSAFVSFKNLNLPCIEDQDVEIQLVRDDLIMNGHSDFQKIDCKSNDFYSGYDFHISAGNYGKYRVMGKMISYGQINQGEIEVHHPDDVDSNKIDKQLPANKAIKLNHIINPFHRNDIHYDEDEINVAIYSDVYEKQFKCGRYELHGSDAIDFKGLTVPCREMIAISLQEVDMAHDDGKTMIIPCAAQNQDFDYIFFDQIQNDVRTEIKNLNLYSQEINSYNPFAVQSPVINFASSLVGKNMGSSSGVFEERDSFYTLSLSGILSFQNVYLDPRFQNEDGQCGANIIRFTDSTDEPKTQVQSAPRLVNIKSLFNQFWVKSQKISMQIYSDYLESIVGHEYDFEDNHSYYNFEDLNIPCKEQLMIKLSDGDDKHHTIAVNCQNKGQQKLSFKLGRFVIDATGEEFTDHDGLQESYSVKKDGEKIERNDDPNAPTKFVVKSVEVNPLYYATNSKNIYVLDLEVIDGDYEKQQYTKGLKNPIKVSGLTHPETIKKERFNHDEDEGFFELDSMALKNATEDKPKVEIYIHSDLDKKNKFIKVFSTKNYTYDGKIPCKTAMILVKTSKGQQMKMIECTQMDNRDLMLSDEIDQVYKKAVFKPNLLTIVDKIHIAQDNENLKNSILRPIINQSVVDIQKYLKKNGSFQRSMIQEMGFQAFDEQLIKSVSEDAELDEITVNYVVKSDIAKKNMALIIQDPQSSTSTDGGYNPMYAIFVLGLALVLMWFMLFKKHPKTTTIDVEMKETLVQVQN